MTDRVVVEKVNGEWPAWVRAAFAPGPKGYSSLTWEEVMARLEAGSAMSGIEYKATE